MCIENDDMIKTIGTCWQPKNDMFKFKINSPTGKINISKREIISELSSVFDPLGLISSVVTSGRFQIYGV